MTTILADYHTGYGDNEILTPWEVHPMLVHMPIAFLTAGVLLSLYATWRGRISLEQVATGLLVTGIVTAVITALAGFLALFTIPETHTARAEQLIYWHLGAQVGALLLFIGAAGWRWRTWAELPPFGARVLGWIGAALLLIGSALGGYIVYHGGVGIDSRIVNPEVHR